jgi:hypothetical protein
MKAIISVNKNSAYAHLNGHTFEVKAIYNTSLDLSINGTTTAFGFSEVVIVDLQSEMQHFFDLFNWDGNTTYVRLQTYCSIKGYQVDVIMNCPA